MVHVQVSAYWDWKVIFSPQQLLYIICRPLTLCAKPVEHILERAVLHETNPVEKRDRGLNRAAVDELLRHREEIMRAHPGEVFEDSVETLRQLREERTRELEQR